MGISSLKKKKRPTECSRCGSVDQVDIVKIGSNGVRLCGKCEEIFYGQMNKRFGSDEINQ